jgi:hypothetical protein
MSVLLLISNYFHRLWPIATPPDFMLKSLGSKSFLFKFEDAPTGVSISVE